MANTLTAPPHQSDANRWLKAIGVAFVLVAAVMVVGVLVMRSFSPPRARPDVESDLLSLVDPTAVPPTYALLVLADYPSDQVWQEARGRQQWDAALALWLFGPVRSDRDSIEALLTLAGEEARLYPDEAAAYLLAAADVTRLSPELEDRERAEFIVLIGEKLRDLGLPSAAVTEWRQASIIAHHSPSLQPLYRASLLHDLFILYREVGAKRLAARAQQNSAQVGNASGVLAVPERIVLDTEVLPEEPLELQEARERRRLAAHQAAQALEVGDPAAAYVELRDALSAEGLLHRAWITEQLKGGHPREVQATLLLYHINWLQRERMLAWGIGGDHFPTWQERRSQIEASLHEAWNALELVRIDQSIREGIQERATLAQRDWWATRLVQERLTRDPGLDRDAVIQSMRPNNADIAGQMKLRLDWIQNRFWRVPREYVGTDSLPE